MILIFFYYHYYYIVFLIVLFMFFYSILLCVQEYCCLVYFICLYMLENNTKNNHHNERPYSSLYVSLFLSRLCWPISPTVPPCHHLWRSGPASWAAQSHYPAKLASGQVWGFFPCVCAVSLLSVTSYNTTSIAGCRSSEWQSVTVQTHNSKQVPLGVWVPPQSLFPEILQQFRLRTQFLAACHCCLVPSPRKAWWKPGQISKTTFNQHLAGGVEVVKHV